MSVKLLTEYHLEFLSFKRVCTGSSEFTVVKNATLLGITCRGSLYLKTSKKRERESGGRGGQV